MSFLDATRPGQVRSARLSFKPTGIRLILVHYIAAGKVKYSPIIWKIVTFAKSLLVGSFFYFFKDVGTS